jgi:outer membrane protein assembly factor BamB
VDRGTVYIGSGLNGNAVVALRTATEEELQRQDLPRQRWQTTTPYPAVGPVTLADDLVLIGCGNSNFVQHAAEPKAAVLALDRRSGSLLWQVEMPETVLGSIPVRDGVAICCARNGEIFALDVHRSGAVLWRKAVRDRSMLKAGPAFTGKHIYVSTHDGHLLVLGASDGVVLEEHRLNSADVPGTMGLSVSSPFVCNGRLFVGSETGGLCCFVGQDVR